MTRMYFHCSNDRGVLIDPAGLEFAGLSEACDHAQHLVQSLVDSQSLEDWRKWILHVTDDQGDSLFVVPFASALSKPH